MDDNRFDQVSRRISQNLTRRNALLAGMGGFVALVAAACGSDDKEETSSTSGAAPTTAGGTTGEAGTCKQNGETCLGWAECCSQSCGNGTCRPT